MRCTDRKKRIRVKQILECLGIKYRPGLDDELWANHGVETVGDFAGYATYLTHETETAIKEGKELYRMDELVSNLTIEEIKKIRDGYLRVSESTKKLNTSDLIALDDTAYKLGYELKNFTEWYDSQPFNVRSNAKMKTIVKVMIEVLMHELKRGLKCSAYVFLFMVNLIVAKRMRLKKRYLINGI